MRRKAWAALALALVLLPAGCSAAPGAGKADMTAASGKGSHWGSTWTSDDKEMKYTKADYDLALSFRTEGYGKQSVAEFNKKVMDWKNEDAYHKTEDAFQRLQATLPKDDANQDFIFRTLFTTWKECEKKHYNACAHSSAPWYGGWAKCETTGDIFGDQVVLAGGYADFDFNYTIPDEDRLTVEERDKLLRGIETGMEEFLRKQDQKALQKEESMEKTLTAELKRQLGALSGGIAWAGDQDVDYSWNQSFDSAWDVESTALVQEGITHTGGDEEAQTSYTKEQYGLVLSTLQFEGWESASIAEFDRRVHRALEGEAEGDAEDGEKFLRAYELVLSYLPENDPNYGFFYDTVRNSQQEYETRAKEVFSGRTADPEITDYCNADVEEDVFGDKVTVGSAEAEYSFTYRILDEDRLTVKERDEFLKAVKQGARDALKKRMESGSSVSKDDFKSAVEAAGKAAASDRIRLTGCIVHSCEVYR